MSPVFVTTPFLVQKALKTANSEKRVFSCQTSKVVPEPPSSLVFCRKPAPDVRRAPKSVFCPERLVTACHRFVTARFLGAKVRKTGPVPELLLRMVFRKPTKDQARSPQPAKVVRQSGMPEPRASKFAGFRWKAGSRQPLCSVFRFRAGKAAARLTDRPAKLAHCAARVRLRARSLWLMSGMCGLSLESQICVWSHLLESAVVSSDAAAFFCSVKKFRMATHVLERREQLRSVLKAAVDAEALKRGASLEEVSRLHDKLARGAPVLERLIADRLAGRFPAEEVDIQDWKEMLKRAQDLQLKLRKRLNARGPRQLPPWPRSAGRRAGRRRKRSARSARP